ncbi:MAG: hypothetical protein A3G18_11455 [Rhodospirillales bacterium RIFCSPLOWO2_12_FULL_58_28]|nr:MAG: hypothetical protein A3H92_10600 [Rhodospirillales bacterium RIFCSPLOWO2_02_FULL_58_16]OHC77799.1 MAG: hypothetical protein A3G18_11455 [Rhodospirillales bacterium RIFCSPLOWO2_12_FULL_58_28]
MRLLPAILLLLIFAVAPAGADDVVPRHGIAMHGEVKYPPEFTHFAYVNPNAPKGGAVKMAAIGGFDSFNGFIIKGEAADGINMIYDTLMVDSADEAFSQYGLLAETIELPEDRSWVAFNLRPEARWHDGKPVTAEDVVFTFNILVEKGQPTFRFYYAGVEKAEATSERRVKFTFKPGDNRELPLILGQLEIMPRHYWQGREFDKTTLEPPLGSGPYKIGSFEANRTVTYRRVADYWGKDLAVNRGQNNFDAYEYDYYRDDTVALEAFKAGEFDMRLENISKNWAMSYDIPAVREGLIRKLEVKHKMPAGLQGFAYNIRRDIFKDARVRQALAYAFDFAWSNKNLFYGQYVRTRSYFDNSEMAATGLPSGDELAILEPYRGRAPDEVFTREYQPPATDGSGNIRANLGAADSLLKDAGWVIRDGKRVREKTGEPLDFEVLLVSPSFERVVLPFAKNLERLGVRMRVRTVDSSQYIKRLETFDFDMTVFSWGQSLSPGNEQRNYWTGDAAARPGSRNVIGIADPAVDELVEKLIASPDRESLVNHIRALDRVLQWGHYVIPHWHLDYQRIALWDKFGMPEATPLRGAQFNAWWIDPGKNESLAARRKRSGK